MPSVNEKQRRFFGAELGRERAGQKTKTGMTESQLEDFAKKVTKPKPKAKGLQKPPQMDSGKEPWER